MRAICSKENPHLSRSDVSSLCYRQAPSNSLKATTSLTHSFLYFLHYHSYLSCTSPVSAISPEWICFCWTLFLAVQYFMPPILLSSLHEALPWFPAQYLFFWNWGLSRHFSSDLLYLGGWFLLPNIPCDILGQHKVNMTTLRPDLILQRVSFF